MKGNYESTINPQLMVMHIIIGALVMGCLCFMGVAAGMHFNKPRMEKPPAPAAGGVPVVVPPQQPPELPILGYLGVMMLTVAVAARFILPGMMQPQLSPPGNLFPGGDAAVEESVAVQKLLGAYQSQLIMLAAMAEGATFMLLVSLQVNDTTWTLPIAIFGMLWILSYFPTYDGLITYLDDQLLQWQMTKSMP